MSTSKGTSIPKCSFTTQIYFITVMVSIYMPIHRVLGFFFLSICNLQEIRKSIKPSRKSRNTGYICFYRIVCILIFFIDFPSTNIRRMPNIHRYFVL